MTIAAVFIEPVAGNMGTVIPSDDFKSFAAKKGRYPINDGMKEIETSFKEMVDMEELGSKKIAALSS